MRVPFLTDTLYVKGKYLALVSSIPQIYHLVLTSGYIWRLKSLDAGFRSAFEILNEKIRMRVPFLTDTSSKLYVKGKYLALVSSIPQIYHLVLTSGYIWRLKSLDAGFRSAFEILNEKIRMRVPFLTDTSSKLYVKGKYLAFVSSIPQIYHLVLTSGYIWRLKSLDAGFRSAFEILNEKIRMRVPFLTDTSSKLYVKGKYLALVSSTPQNSCCAATCFSSPKPSK